MLMSEREVRERGVWELSFIPHVTIYAALFMGIIIHTTNNNVFNIIHENDHSYRK